MLGRPVLVEAGEREPKQWLDQLRILQELAHRFE